MLKRVMDTHLSNFTDNLNIAIIGSTGGIGSNILSLLLQDMKVEKLYSFSRNVHDIENNKLVKVKLDISSQTSINNAIESLESDLKFDIILVTTGILHDEENLQPEKSLRDINKENFERVFEINTIGPALIMRYFLPKLKREEKSIFAAISARVGSISDNTLGGWYAYRASKAALNMLIKNASIEMARRYKEAAVIGLHPGPVDTGLSEPFQGNVPPGKLFTPEYSGKKMLEVINKTTAQQTGKIFAWDGTEIPY